VLFVEHNIEGIKGDSKEDFINKVWFQTIYRTILEWYEKRYGAAAKRAQAFLLGACEVAGAFFEIRVPVTILRRDKPGETVWLVFPIDLQPEENPTKWFVTPPNFGSLKTEDRIFALEKAQLIAHLLRSIHSDLMMATRPSGVAVALGDKILPHLAAAAEHLVRQRAPTPGLSVWESHQAVESALKLLSRQINGKHERHHDLVQLFRDVSSSLASIDERSVNKMPSQKKAIQARAGEATIGLTEAYDIYQTSLNLTAAVGEAMPGMAKMRNTAFLLKKAPFI
jgi:HEPN domain-containing protein